MTVTVFTRENCNACWAVQKFLDQRGIHYDTAELTEEVAAEYKAQGFMSAPIVIHNGRPFAGWNTARLQEIVRDHGERA